MDLTSAASFVFKKYLILFVPNHSVLTAKPYALHRKKGRKFCCKSDDSCEVRFLPYFPRAF